ncbi:MAG: hypothetical protein K0R62_8630 [Nonomuraea muscovyensis]|jgi:hypothetical protein|nr:hypothetical protein [Nonomuraea muscovyensis]
MFSRLTTRAAASAVAVAALGSSLVFGAATATATPADDQFVKVVDALGIPVNGPEQAVKLGGDICTLLTQNGASGPNPVPVVRGVVTTLTNNGLEKGQAVSVMRAAVSLYCPQYGTIVR